MATQLDTTRRDEIEDMMRNGAMTTTKRLAQRFNVTERTIQRDLKYLREVNSGWLTEISDSTLISLFKETHNGYYRDIEQVTDLMDFEVRTSRDREVKGNLIRLRADLRKESLGLLMKGPLMWQLDRLAQSNKVINLEKPVPKAIYGEILHNTDKLPEEIGHEKTI